MSVFPAPRMGRESGLGLGDDERAGPTTDPAAEGGVTSRWHTIGSAAVVLALSTWQVRRLLKAYRASCFVAFVSQGGKTPSEPTTCDQHHPQRKCSRAGQALLHGVLARATRETQFTL